MARYFENAKLLINLVKDKNRLKSQVISPSDALQINKSLPISIGLDVFNVKVFTRAMTTDTKWDVTFNWDEDNWDDVKDNEKVIVGQLREDWNSYAEFVTGTSSNVNIEFGDIRLNI